MTGVLNAVIGANNAIRISVTIGNQSTQYGFNTNGSIGSISPGTFKGNTIDVLASDTSYDIGVVLLGSGIPQAYFTSITVESTAGTIGRFLSTAATFSQTTGIHGPQSQWLWGIGSSKVWTSTSPSPRSVLIQY